MPELPEVETIAKNLSKLKKYGTLRVDNYVIKVDDILVKQIKVFGELKA